MNKPTQTMTPEQMAEWLHRGSVALDLLREILPGMGLCPRNDRDFLLYVRNTDGVVITSEEAKLARELIEENKYL